MTVITFTVLGEPIGKARARSTKSGRHYTPAKTEAYERAIGWCARQAIGPARPLEGPLRFKLEAVHGIPASWSKKRSEAALAGEVPKTSKPDLSNIVKIVEDGMNGIVYVDDSQIVTIVASKRYGAEPAIHIEVRPA
jgi:Holliday junction resolvase RusA-like endonuclease